MQLVRGSRTRVALVLALGILAASWAEAEFNLKIGDAFPNLALDGLMNPSHYAELGLKESGGPFHLGEVSGELLVLEYFNKSCRPCQPQVREVEGFYQRLTEANLKDRIRLLAVAEGNDAKYLGKYIEKRGLTFPIAADPQFEHYDRLGGVGRTPFTVYLVRRQTEWKLAGTHVGGMDAEEIFSHALNYLRGPDVVASSVPETYLIETHPQPPLDPLEQARRARELLSRIVGAETTVVPVDLPGDVRVFRAVAPEKAVGLYARVASRLPVCEICHPVHFVFAFDREGHVRGFDPIYVTKWGNVEWSDQDARYFESRLRDREIRGLAFDPEVDAVSSATMSSAIIFDAVRRTASLLETLRLNGDP